MATGNLPLQVNTDRPAHFPVKYGDNLWVREMGKDLERIVVRPIKVRCRISDPDDPSDPSAVTAPIYGPIEIPDLNGRVILGAYAPAFTMDPSGAFDPSSPDPSAIDAGVVRVIAAPYGPTSIRFALFALDTPGDWPGATAGSLVTPRVMAAAEKFGLTQDYQALMDGIPAQTSYIRGTIVNHIETVSTGDPSDPSAVNTYKLQLANGCRIEVDVPVGDDQPAVEMPWPLDQESSRYSYQVLDTHEYHQGAYPRRNAFAIPNLGDDPQHDSRSPEHVDPFLVVDVRTENTQDPVDGNAQVQVVTLNNGQDVRVPVGVTIVPGQEFDPSGMDPSAGDPSGFTQDAIDPTDWWEFTMFLILAADDEGDGTVAGYAADIWPLMPADLTGADLTPIVS